MACARRSRQKGILAFCIGVFVVAGLLFAIPSIATAADVTINVPTQQPTIAAATTFIRNAAVAEETNYAINVAPGTYSGPGTPLNLPSLKLREPMRQPRVPILPVIMPQRATW